MRACTLGWSLVLGLGACFQDRGGDDGGPFPGPRPGAWVYAEGNPTDDTCAWDDRPRLASGEFDVANGDDGTFSVLASMGGEPTACVLMDMDFACDPVQADVPVSMLDAEIETISVTSGTFETRQYATGIYEMAVDCSGAECSAAANAAGIIGFPCSYKVPITGSFADAAAEG